MPADGWSDAKTGLIVACEAGEPRAPSGGLLRFLLNAVQAFLLEQPACRMLGVRVRCSWGCTVQSYELLSCFLSRPVLAEPDRKNEPER